MSATQPNQASTPPMSEAIARYLQGPPPESRQFDFFVGRWACVISAGGAAGTPLTELQGEWHARRVQEGRVIADELTVFLPTGECADGWLSLRTYAPETGHWEIAGVRALSPVSTSRTIGDWDGNEMHLAFTTEGPNGPRDNTIRFFNIGPQSFEWEWNTDLGEGGTPEWTRFAHIRATRVE